MSLHPVLFCFNRNREIYPVPLFHQAADTRPREVVLLGDLRQRHPRAAIKYNLLPVDIKPRTPYDFSFRCGFSVPQTSTI